MGNRNVERCIFARPGITGVPWAARYCLLVMAKLAHDDTQLYWGGVEYLELAMGYDIGPTGRRRVMEHIARLEGAGYITRTSKRHGRRLVYELHLPQLLGPVDIPWMGGH